MCFALYFLPFLDGTVSVCCEMFSLSDALRVVDDSIMEKSFPD